MVTDPVTRFLSYIDQQSECWIWKGTPNAYGYGRFNVAVAPNRSRTYLAHRFSYEKFVESIPDGMCVLHRCDNTSCVNPDHLFLGTQADNIADAARKGRMKGRPGERDGKLTREQREEICLRYSGQYGEQSELAREYGVTQARIWQIVNGIKCP